MTHRNIAGLVVFIMGISCAQAGTIVLDSNTTLTNDTTANTYAIAPFAVWAPAIGTSEWISDVSTTSDFVVAGTVVNFTDEFFLGPGNWSGTLSIFADDSTSVILDGVTLFNVNTQQGGYCAANPIGCVPGTEGIIPLTNLAPGAHTLTLGVRQGKSYSPFGLDFEAILNTTSTVPEPSSPVLIGAGLLAIAFLSRRLRVLNR